MFSSKCEPCPVALPLIKYPFVNFYDWLQYYSKALAFMSQKTGFAKDGLWWTWLTLQSIMAYDNMVLWTAY